MDVQAVLSEYDVALGLLTCNNTANLSLFIAPLPTWTTCGRLPVSNGLVVNSTL